ncbi:MAG: hypothetical protein V4582_16920 [Pseudomonadota bacterium]
MSVIASPLAYLHLAAGRVKTLFQFPAPAEPPHYPFADSDIAMLDTLTRAPDGATIDEQSWEQLMLPQYAQLLGQDVSIFGRQMLHRRLKAGLVDAPCVAQVERVRALLAQPAVLDELHLACRPLRGADVELAAPLFDTGPCPARPRWLDLVPLAFLAACGAAWFSGLAWAAIVIGMLTLMGLNVQYHALVLRWARLLGALEALLLVCRELGRRGEPALAPFAPIGARAGQLRGAISFNLGESMSPLTIYREWFFLGRVKDYFSLRRIVDAHADFLRECYLCVANFEADLALARHLRSTEHCWAERHAGAAIALDAVVHPLLAQAAPLSIALHERGAFVSGRNGVGKSTLLRTVGLNLIVARAFGFCYARAASVPFMPVYASMQSEDTLLGGESLYIAELRRARQLLALADGAHPGVYLIDEIFRGTNHLESVSAAASVLDQLAERAMVIVSSHNLVLAPLLAHRLQPLCVSEADDGSGLQLRPGVLAHTNGITLLETQGFSPALRANAARVFDWLSAYLAQGADCAHVLGAAPAPQEREAVH